MADKMKFSFTVERGQDIAEMTGEAVAAFVRDNLGSKKVNNYRFEIDVERNNGLEFVCRYGTDLAAIVHMECVALADAAQRC